MNKESSEIGSHHKSLELVAAAHESILDAMAELAKWQSEFSPEADISKGYNDIEGHKSVLLAISTLLNHVEVDMIHDYHLISATAPTEQTKLQSGSMFIDQFGWQGTVREVIDDVTAFVHLWPNDKKRRPLLKKVIPLNNLTEACTSCRSTQITKRDICGFGFCTNCWFLREQ